MESNKRVRTELPEWTSPGKAWTRMVLKLIFLMTRLSTMLIELLHGRDLRLAEEMTEEEEIDRKKQPFSVWPLLKKLEPGTFSEIADSDFGFSMIPKSPSTTSSTPSPLALDPDYYLERKVDEDLPICEHGEVCDLWMTRKAGRNFQRMFWRCPLPIGRQCEMFQWCNHQPYWQEPAPQSQAARSQRSVGYTQRSDLTSAPRQGASSSSASRAAPVTPEGGPRAREQELCNHMGPKCRQGSNGAVEKVTCLKCGKLLVDRQRSPQEIEERAQNRQKAKAKSEAKKSENLGGKASGSTQKISPEEMDEFQEFQKFQEWRRNRKPPSPDEMDQFGVEIAKEVASYGGIFVFEHPVTSKAWSDRILQQLMMREDVILATGDQCMFGLQSRTGIPRRKTTGWCTNSPTIAEFLSVRCDGGHQHDVIIGKDGSENKSAQAQRYPAGLVQAIIKGYKKQIHEELLHVNFTRIDHLVQDCHHLQRVRAELVTTENLISDFDITTEETFQKNFDILAAEGDDPENPEVPDEEDAPEELDLPEETRDSEDVEDGQKDKYVYLPREKPFSLPQLVKRAHDGLGHPSNDRLVRILRHAGASNEAIKVAREHKCAVCARHEKVKPPRPAAPPRTWQMNQVVGVDTVWLPTLGKKTKMALNIVCWASRFQMVIPLEHHTPAAARRAYLQWLRLFGPPERVYVDLGTEFKGTFMFGSEVDSTYYEPASLEMPTQRSITERAGKAFKEVFSRALEHHTCTDDEEWRNLVDITMMTCNRLMNKSGFSPIQRVLGYTPRVPGGLFTGGLDLATAGKIAGGDLAIQKSQAMRLAAARAFHEADCSQALRNALHAGPRPQREFEPGQLVYFWRKGAERALKDKPIFWRGPARVILTAMPTSVWLTYRGYVIKAAPEHLRHANEEEHLSLSEWIDDITKTKEEIEQKPRRGYIDLTAEEFPTEEEQQQPLPDEEAPRLRLRQKTASKQVIRRNSPDEWRYNPATGELVRHHYNPRRNKFVPTESPHDCPVNLEEIDRWRKTIMRSVDGVLMEEEEDEWEPGQQETDNLDDWVGRTYFRVQGDSPVPPEEDVRRVRPRLEPQPLDLPEFMEPHSNGAGEPGADGGEQSQDDYEPEEPLGEEGASSPTTRVRTHSDEDGDQEDRPAKRLRTEFLEVYMQTLEKAIVAKLKKKVLYKNMTAEMKTKFDKAIQREIKNNIESGAYEILDRQTSEEIRRTKPDKIVQSRYVLTEKPIETEDIDKAAADGVLLCRDGDSSKKAKARHVMKGFSEENSEYLEVTTPQVGRETVLFTLQILASLQWLPGYLDFTQAFHSGDALQREIFAELPHEGLPGCHPRQLLRLRKCCYGLLDGPFQWFNHLQRILTQELGYEVSTADPCLFLLFGENRKLRGIISVATDDLLHGGDELHWEKMEWLNQHYRLGKFSKGDGRFVGKEIKCHPDGSILINQPLYTKEKVKEIPIAKERKGRKLTFCNKEEISQLRGLLGSLAWLSKETRPDLAGRTALLQQSMPTPYIQDLLEANALAREALKTPEVGIRIQPIPLERLRIGTVTDASWGNVRSPESDEPERDYWLEKADRWIRVHIQPRRILFHPGSAPGGPDLYEIQNDRVTEYDNTQKEDVWNHRDSQHAIGDRPWTGQTTFLKKNAEKGKKETMNERFLQNQRLASQGGYITFFYDSRMETEESSFPISIITWKSYKVKRCTVNTLSAECQAMIQGVGSLHWIRALLEESKGTRLDLEHWEQQVASTPFIAVTDSKSLYDTGGRTTLPKVQKSASASIARTRQSDKTQSLPTLLASRHAPKRSEEAETAEAQGILRKDLIWLVRAAHHLPASELNGQERLPRDEGALRRLVSHLYTLKKEHFREFRPQPWSKPKFFPLVYVVTTCDDCTEVQLKRLERMRFSRGGIISVIRIPDQPWCRESSQDDKWAWGTLMPLYFKVIGKLEQHWLVNFFGTQWDGDELIINQQVNQEFFQRQWNADSDKLFARHVGLALVHPHPTSPDRVLLLTVFQHDPEDDVTGGAWAVPGGSVDRGKDRNWIQAAMREFEEEVNPSGDAQWSAAAAFSSGEYQLVSLQNLLPETDIQNLHLGSA
eukprot:s1146_g19.t1